jgi:hypothetical protein
MTTVQILENFDPRLYFSGIWRAAQLETHRHKMQELRTQNIPQEIRDNLQRFEKGYSAKLDQQIQKLILEHQIPIEQRFVSLMNYWISAFTNDLTKDACVQIDKEQREFNRLQYKSLRYLNKVVQQYRQDGLCCALGKLFEYDEQNRFLGMNLRIKFQDVVQIDSMVQRN